MIGAAELAAGVRQINAAAAHIAGQGYESPVSARLRAEGFDPDGAAEVLLGLALDAEGALGEDAPVFDFLTGALLGLSLGAYCVHTYQNEMEAA